MSMSPDQICGFGQCHLPSAYGISGCLNSQELEILRQFFAACFHQDWMLDDLDTNAVLTKFLQTMHPVEELGRLASLVERYAQSRTDDKELEKALYTVLNCYYLPSADGVPVRAWLLQISKRLRTEGR